MECPAPATCIGAACECRAWVLCRSPSFTAALPLHPSPPSGPLYPQPPHPRSRTPTPPHPPAAQLAAINLGPHVAVEGEGELHFLTAEHPEDENTFDNPTKVREMWQFAH